MKTNSKRIKNLKTFINKPIYTIDEGLVLIKKLSSALFLESVEIHISLNINSKNINQQVKGNLLLPNIVEKNKKIAIFTDENNEDLIKLGASMVGYEDL